MNVVEARRVRDQVWPKVIALLPARMNTKEAMAFVFAVGFQETRFETRKQYNGGPARSYLQFEEGGGVHGVLNHWASDRLATEVCRERGVKPIAHDVWKAMETDDILGFAFGRLLLYTSPHKVPLEDQRAGAWAMYATELWRPSKPHIDRWPASHELAWVLTHEVFGA